MKQKKPVQKPKFSPNSKINIVPHIQTNKQKDLNKIIKSYRNFIKKYSKELQLDLSPFDKNIEEKKSEKIAEKIPEIKSNIVSNIIIQVKETNSGFHNFLDTIKPDFLEENIICELPDLSELYANKKQLGLNKNNKVDFIRRKAELLKEYELLIPEDLPTNYVNIEPTIDMNNDINIDNTRIELNKDELISANPPVPDDQTEIMNKIKSMNTIVDICQPRLRREILFIGYDPENKKDILRIFGKKFDENGKMRIIEYNSFSIRFDIGINLEKTVKELLGVESISKEEIKPKMIQIINKFRA